MDEYGPRWRALTLHHATIADHTLPHQVRFNKEGGNLKVTVSCNCRERAGLPAMGTSQNLMEARGLYDNPTNHVEPFSVEDMAKW